VSVPLTSAVVASAEWSLQHLYGPGVRLSRAAAQALRADSQQHSKTVGLQPGQLGLQAAETVQSDGPGRPRRRPGCRPFGHSETTAVDHSAWSSLPECECLLSGLQQQSLCTEQHYLLQLLEAVLSHLAAWVPIKKIQVRLQSSTQSPSSSKATERAVNSS
jgi:hypothetical protein